MNQPVSWNVIPGFCCRCSGDFFPSSLEGWKPIASPKKKAGYETHYLFFSGDGGLLAWA